MVNKSNRKKINSMLLQESIWKIEDKINVILESTADHEAELIRLRNSLNLLLHKLEVSEIHSSKNIMGGSNGLRKNTN